MELSRFFSLDELTRSDTAQREGIPNVPAEAQISNLQALCRAVLDPLRTAVGLPVKVNSGYRSPTLNRRIGGVSNSQHVDGMAADIQAPGIPVLSLFKRIIELRLPFDQLIYEAVNDRTKWVHVSHNSAGNRGEIMAAKFGPDGRATAYPRVTVAQALAMDEPGIRGIGIVEMDYVEMDDAPVVKRRPPAKKRAVKRPKAKVKGAKTKRPVKKAVAKAGKSRVATKKAPARKPAKKRAKAVAKKAKQATRR
jgi:hypothetical protein